MFWFSLVFGFGFGLVTKRGRSVPYFVCCSVCGQPTRWTERVRDAPPRPFPRPCTSPYRTPPCIVADLGSRSRSKKKGLCVSLFAPFGCPKPSNPTPSNPNPPRRARESKVHSPSDDRGQNRPEKGPLHEENGTGSTEFCSIEEGERRFFDSHSWRPWPHRCGL